jgi:hypothetical protein
MTEGRERVGKNHPPRDKRFRPGKSGNPGGMKPFVKEIRELARAQTQTAIDALIKIAESGKQESARVHAAEVLLAYAWGRPQASLDVTSGGEPIITRVEVSFADADTYRQG